MICYEYDAVSPLMKNSINRKKIGDIYTIKWLNPWIQ